MLNNKWRLATSQSGLQLGHIKYLGLPKPSAQFADFAEERPQGDGGTKALGYKSVALTFSQLSRDQITTLEILVSAARSGTSLFYVTVPRNDGSGVFTWIDVSGLVARLAVTPLAGQRSHMGAATAVISLNNVTVINDPSTYL